MHKKIKYIIAASLVIATVSSALPADKFILGITNTYASTYNNASDGELSSLSVTRGTGSEIKLRDSYSGDEVSLTEEKEYYIELTGANGFHISANVKGSGYVVKQFKSTDKTEKGEDVGDFTSIDSEYSNIYLRTYESEEAYKDAYDNKDVTDCEETYIIHVKKPVAISEEEEDKDYAYLKNIYLSNGEIHFSKNTTSYDVNVGEDVSELLVRATPEDDDDLVRINDIDVEKDDNYEKTVSLNKGENTISIYLENDEDDITYTLNVNRGKETASTKSKTSSSVDVEDSVTKNYTGKFNSWQRIDGKLKYVDGTGEVLKNKWWFDQATSINYYLKEDGSRATGWFFDNNNWYHFNENGEMQTGWINVDKNWYYLNKSGAMEMGWLEDSAGNWYYLDSSGAMKTGWIEDSNGKWYYLDSTGKMTKNSAINGYNFGNDGVLVN